MDEETEVKPFGSDELPTEEINSKPKSKSRRRKNPKNGAKITKKTIAKVDKELLKEYRAYANKIRLKKNCRIMSFPAFAKKRMSVRKGKKSRKGSRKTQKNMAEEMSSPTPEETSSMAEEMPSVPPQEESSMAEETTSVPPPEQQPLEESTSTPPEEPESGIVKTVSDALGLSPTEKKAGGKRRKK